MTIFTFNSDVNNVQHNHVADACQLPKWFFDSHMKLNDANVILCYLHITLNVYTKKLVRNLMQSHKLQNLWTGKT